MDKKEHTVKYGILCPSTNIFYEIQDESTYQALLQELLGKTTREDNTMSPKSLTTDTEVDEE